MAIQQYVTENTSGATQTFPSSANAAKLFILQIMEERWQAPLIAHRFPGVEGEKHYVDSRKGRQIIADVQLYDYASQALLDADHAAIEAFTHALTGPLTLDNVSYDNCTFAGVQPIGPRRFDGSGAHGWNRKLRLFWVQRSYP